MSAQSTTNGRTVEEGRTIRITLRIGGLILIDRIAGNDALYGASVAVQTFETIRDAIINPIDLADIADVNSTKETVNIKHHRIHRIGEVMLQFPKNANCANLLKKIKMSASRKPVLKFIIYCICKKRSVD